MTVSLTDWQAATLIPHLAHFSQAAPNPLELICPSFRPRVVQVGGTEVELLLLCQETQLQTERFNST